MEEKILKLSKNRVRRNYLGGEHIDALQHIASQGPSDMPEEWIASIVEAKNPGLEEIKNEGLSKCIYNGKEIPLIDVIKSDPEFWLGKKDASLGFLFKILDSSMRLHVQAHPTADFAKKYLNSKYGKLETYYILDCFGDDGYIRIGFQHAPTKEEWKRIIETQDIKAMDSCFEKVPVKPGDVWIIPGGVPHAIGENVMMLEIMEPSDLVVRCEYNREGIIVPPEARFMNRTLDFCLDIFDYTEYSVSDAEKNFKLDIQNLHSDSTSTYDVLVSHERVNSFEVRRLRLAPNSSIALDVDRASAALLVKGRSSKLSCADNSLSLQKGEEAFISASAKKIEVQSYDEEIELCLVFDYS